MTLRIRRPAPLLCGLLLTLPFASQSIPASQAAQEPPQAPAKPPAATGEQVRKDPQSSFEPRSGPGEGQKLMEKFVGEWDVVKSLFPAGKEPVRTKGTCHQAMVNEGRFLHSQFLFEDPLGGKPTTGVGLLGFDPKTGIFTSVWVDSRSTAMSFRQSEGKFDGEQIILVGRSLDPAMPPRASRTVAKLEDNGRKLFHRQYNRSADGTERLLMELAMTRREIPAKVTPAARPAGK